MLSILPLNGKDLQQIPLADLARTLPIALSQLDTARL